MKLSDRTMERLYRCFNVFEDHDMAILQAHDFGLADPKLPVTLKDHVTVQLDDYGIVYAAIEQTDHSIIVRRKK